MRELCLSLPEATERISHGEPTFFVRTRVFAMCSVDHHGDGRIAVVVPFDPGLQMMMIESAPKKFYYPPYVGRSGWLGIVLERIGDRDLREHIVAAWRRVAPKRILDQLDS